ncbi:Uncharacterised protein [Candidatus Tiddalikarchaeum anstoanum]|nr:Uncharacterised protein [Candidatus Tiddalikarchaeum anstoanum]
MAEESSKFFLQNLVQRELKTYIDIVNSYPNVNDEHHFNPLRSTKHSVYRAIHWYLLDNRLIYQTESAKDNNFDYKIIWKMKDFDKDTVVGGIIKKYQDYLEYFLEDLKLETEVNESFESFLKRKSTKPDLILNNIINEKVCH